MSDDGLTSCGCCQTGSDPAAVTNPPGQSALKYRIGTYASFLHRMLDSISQIELPDESRPLQALTTREPSDDTIALLDASAMVADVLAFYQERIANEGYLRTATERYSVQELARQIGYLLGPGVAASVYLAFNLETAPGSPSSVSIPQGLKVQSIPAQGKLPQTFETGDAFVAQAAWGSLKPRLTVPATLDSGASYVIVEGYFTDIKVNDLLLFETDGVVKRVLAVAPDSVKKQTRIDIDSTGEPKKKTATYTKGKPKIGFDFEQSAIDKEMTGTSWSEQDLGAMLGMNNKSPQQLADYINRPKTMQIEQTIVRGDTLPAKTPGLFRFKTVAGAFGNSAPVWSSITQDGTGTAAFPSPGWDDGNQDILHGAPHNSGTRTLYSTSYGVDVLLDRTASDIGIGGYVVIREGSSIRAKRVKAVKDLSVADFAITAKVTGLLLEDTSDLDSFRFRTVAYHANSEELALSELPIAEPVGQGSAEPTKVSLDRMVLGLAIGQAVALTGEYATLPGVTGSEILVIRDINHVDGFTILEFETAIQNGYTRTTVTMNANVVAATHGETVQEVLGSGDGAKSLLSFKLKKPPLTYVSSSAPSGSSSTLTVRVDDVAWSETRTFYQQGPHDQIYIVRIDDGQATVTFGDGQTGLRPPTGQENITATYRSGIGPDGEVDAGSISLLQQKLLGLKSVVNPLAASGAAAPEDRDSARTNAPLTVITLDRVVSVTDFEDFARAFAGIGDAQATALVKGETQLLHLTVVDEHGKEFDASAKTLTSLVDALDAARDTTKQVMVAGPQVLNFNVEAGILVDSRYEFDKVKKAVTDKLLATFCFGPRTFAQPVSAAEVITAIQGIAGVVMVDLNALSMYTDPAGKKSTLASVLPSLRARWNGEDIDPAQLLVIAPGDVILTEIQS
ncbi:MAG TPA: putative baseplate assembly protein [Fimbriimonadaceae bacterium]|nr:putative baseplate assembly protein [Fimbriimonadaceae bacterium]